MAPAYHEQDPILSDPVWPCHRLVSLPVRAPLGPRHLAQSKAWRTFSPHKGPERAPLAITPKRKGLCIVLLAPFLVEVDVRHSGKTDLKTCSSCLCVALPELLIGSVESFPNRQMVPLLFVKECRPQAPRQVVRWNDVARKMPGSVPRQGSKKRGHGLSPHYQVA